jgi:hypothetical protein
VAICRYNLAQPLLAPPTLVTERRGQGVARRDTMQFVAARSMGFEVRQRPGEKHRRRRTTNPPSAQRDPSLAGVRESWPSSRLQPEELPRPLPLPALRAQATAAS